MPSEVPLHRAPFLHIQTAPTFDSSLINVGRVRRHSPTRYTIICKDVEQMAKRLSDLPDVLAVWPGVIPQLHNRIGAGFSQNNTQTLNWENAFDRIWQNQSITGLGITVTVWDTYLDTNSTFFYDPEHESLNDTIIPDHRKVVYNFWHAEVAPEFGEHGTHTSGTIAGNATDPTSPAAQFNGVAPSAKLAFRGWPIEDEEWDGVADELTSIMNRVNSTITSNSWGASTTSGPMISAADQAAVDSPEKLFVFSAGNDGSDGFGTVGSPAEAKNVLTVGALNQLQVANPPDSIRYALLPGQFEYVTTWATLAPGTPLVDFVEDGSGMALIAAYNARDLTVDLSQRVVLITSQNDINQLVGKPARQQPFAAVTNVSLNAEEARFPVLVLDDPSSEFWNLVYNHYNSTQYIVIYREYRRTIGTAPDLAYYSSLGPAFSGLLKPDIVASGSGIVSAMSIPNGSRNHGQDASDANVMQGTSMSCPNVAGSAALVTEYLQKFHGVNPSSSLVKAVMLGSADLPYESDPEPDVLYGFGVLNLGGHLPGNTNLFKLLVNDNVVIRDRSHLVATLDITNASTEFRITISFLDVVTDLDGYVPLIAELSLIVESPNGVFYRGNQHPGGTEEYFSTNQRVILYPGRFAVGQWKIHVIANLGELVDEIKFAAVARGALSNENLVFTPTLTCVSCGTGECDSATGLCSCSNDTLGQSCHLPIHQILADTDKIINISSQGNAYLSFRKPEGTNGNLSLIIEIIDSQSVSVYPYIHLFLAPEAAPSAFPRDYDEPDWGVGVYQNVFVSGPGDIAVSILIHNPHYWTASYAVSTHWVPFPSSSPSPGSSPLPSSFPIPNTSPPLPNTSPSIANTSPADSAKEWKAKVTGLSAALGVVAVVAVVLVILLCLGRRRKDETTGQVEFKAIL